MPHKYYKYRPTCLKCRKRITDFIEEKGKHYCLKCAPSNKKAKEDLKRKEINAEYYRQLEIANRPYKRDTT